jgi:hypothetical protein
MASYEPLTTGEPDISVRPAYGDPEAEHGYGWVLFAGIMLMVVGMLNFIYGIAAVSNSKFYARDATYILSDLNTYGWILLIVGAIQFCLAFAIWAGTEWGRWLGVLAAAVNAITQLLFIPSYPLASLALFTIDILVIYGLVAYGGHRIRGA